MDINKRQRQIIIGTLLGDGHLEKNGRYTRLRIDHRQKDYVEWKYTELSKIVTAKPRIVLDKCRSSNNKFYRRWHVSTYSIPELDEYREIFYRDGRKCIPSGIGGMLDSPLALAVWYMDDGYKRNDCAALRLNTDAFTCAEQNLLLQMLKNNFAICANLHRKGKWHNIYVPQQEALKFCTIIRPFVLPTLEYKLL